MESTRYAVLIQVFRIFRPFSTRISKQIGKRDYLNLSPENGPCTGMDNEVAGLPDGTIRAQVGHISPQVMKRYSHIRRQELNRAAAALEPKFLQNTLVITPEDAHGATVQ